MTTSPKSVLQFWFAPDNQPRWFVKDPAFDREIAEKFLDLYRRAQRSELDSWQETPQGRLALILLFDQFARNMFRGSPEAFAGDARALALTKDGLAKGDDKKLNDEQRMFFYMPLMHSENLDDQNLSVELTRELADGDNSRYAILHRDIIARFGRFPHRNEITGRKSTAAEIAFLKEPNSSF